MGTYIEKLAPDVLARELVLENEDVNSLHLANKNHREAFLLALEERPSLLSKVREQNAEHFLKFAVEKNHEYFVYLSREQYREELAQLYLSKRIEEAEDENKKTVSRNSAFSAQKSMDDKLVFNYSYVTPADEELYYFDKELQVPTSLRSSAKVTLKLTDALALIDKLDIHITLLGARKIKSVIDNVISSSYKLYLNSYINEKNVGYYTLCTSFEDLQGGFINKLNEVFKPYGITVSEFIIKKIAIPQDLQYKIEDQAFRIRQHRAEIEADAEFAKKSLENYEAKLIIQEKYPNAEHSLTEYEKDLALKRYMIKTGREAEEELDRDISIQQKLDAKDDEIEKLDDIVPEITPKKNTFRQSFIKWAVFCAIASVITMIINPGVGFIVLGATTLLFGIIAAFNHHKFATPKVEAEREGDTYSGYNG